MADYWKSYERKYCDFCRSWFVNNKANVQFHENSEKHKANVQKRVDQIRRNKKAEDKAKLEERLTVIRVENAARFALQKQGKFSGISAKQLHNELNKVADERIYNEIYEKASQTSWCEIINAQGQRFFKNASTGEVTTSKPLQYLTLEEHQIVYPDMPSNDSSREYVHVSRKRLPRDKKENPKKEVNEFAEMERIIKAHKEKEEITSKQIETKDKVVPPKQTNGFYGKWEIVEKKVKPDLELPSEIKFTPKHTSGEKQVEEKFLYMPEKEKFTVEFQEMKPNTNKNIKTVEFKERKVSRGRNIKNSQV